MRIPQCAPGEGGRDGYEHWSNWEVEPGKTHFAYVAGPAMWFLCHPRKGTKPCVFWMTKGALPCKYCGLGKETAEIGYQPLWRATDSRPKFVVVWKAEREHLDGIPNLTRVQVARETDAGATIFVRKCLNQEPPFKTALLTRMVEQDISANLLTIWEIPELTAWLRCRASDASDIALSQTAAPTFEPVEPPAAEAHKPDAQPYTPPAGDGAAQSADYAEVVNRIKGRTGSVKTSANGQHDKK